MTVNRREFLASLGASSLVYIIGITPTAKAAAPSVNGKTTSGTEDTHPAVVPDVDYMDYLILDGGKATAHSNRTELGQGLKTVLAALVSQGLGLPRKKVKIILGDTATCPDDGPTTGSCATGNVGWAYWLVCTKVRNDLQERAAKSLNLPASQLDYRKGYIVNTSNPKQRISIFELGKGERVVLHVDPTQDTSDIHYKDLKIANVLGKQIVTGKIKYAGDVRLAGTLYGGLVQQPYHRKYTQLVSADWQEASQMEGVRSISIIEDNIAVIGDSYRAVENAKGAVRSTWSKPKRRKKLNIEKEIVSKRKLDSTIAKRGDANSALASADHVVNETYSTQYCSHAQLETDTVVARYKPGATVVYIGGQYPYKTRGLVAKGISTSEKDVRVIAKQCGGAFGGKTTLYAGAQAAAMSKLVGKPVKVIYSRVNQFRLRGRGKEAVVVDLQTGFNNDGTIVAQKIDSHQDRGKGLCDVYYIPNLDVRLYDSDMPILHAPMRGTSFVQNVFALESHIDTLAHSVGMDPIDFRKRNLAISEFSDLLDLAADMIGYWNYVPPKDHGMGVALISHGGRQYGAMILEASLDRSNGQARIERVALAINIGLVVCRRTLEVGIKGAITWGVGFALHEELPLDGHSVHASNYLDYHVPRFVDIPREIKIGYIDHEGTSAPRGCGEMPVIPVAPALCNALFNITGKRLRRTPFTPERVKKALGATS